MRLKPCLTTLTLIYALAACNSNEQSGFAGARKADNASPAKKNEKDPPEEDDDPKKTSKKDPEDDEKLDDDEDDRDEEDERDDEDENEDINDDSDSDLENSDDLSVEDAKLVAKLPGVKVIKVGVNFEDLGFNAKSDNDFNDAVLCFDGKFKVEKTNVVSIKPQTVIGTTFSSSGCNHKVRVEITHKDGSKEPNIEFDSRAGTPVSMEFKTGSKLEVFMTPYKGCNEDVTRTMHEEKHALVKPDVCKNTGG